MNKFSRRDFLRGAAVGTAGALLAACGGDEDPTNTPVEAVVAATAPPVMEEIELRMGWWGGLARDKLYNAIADLYQERHPNVTIVREYAGWSDYWTKVATQSASGNLPDVTASVIDSLSEYAKRGAYQPLDPYIEAGTIDTSEWPESVIRTCSVDGKVYMLATGTTIHCNVYNEDMLERVGADPPDYEMSYDDFVDYMVNLKDKLPDDVYSVADGQRTQEIFQAWILQNGYQIANEDATDVGFPVEVAISFFKYWTDLYDTGVVLPIELSEQPLGDAWADSWIAKGTVASRWTNSNQLKIFDGYTDDSLVIMRAPTMPDGAEKYGEYLRPSALSMASNTKLGEEAAKYIDFFVNDIEACKIFNAELGAVAPQDVREAMAGSVHPKDTLVFDHFAIVTEDLPYKMPDPKGTSAVLQAFQRASESTRYGKPIEEASETLVREATEAYQAANA
jgi:multiple sugar transport system substrate-binding protein